MGMGKGSSLCSLQGPYDRSATFFGRYDRRWPRSWPGGSRVVVCLVRWWCWWVVGGTGVAAPKNFGFSPAGFPESGEVYYIR